MRHGKKLTTPPEPPRTSRRIGFEHDEEEEVVVAEHDAELEAETPKVFLPPFTSC